MKTLHILTILLAVVISIASQVGVAEDQNRDRTGSPDGSNTCGACHTGGSYNPQMAISIIDSGGDPVSAYTPGEEYTMTFQVQTFIPFPDVYGFQATALFNDLSDAGSFSSPSSNAQLEEVNTASIPSRHIVEHNSPSFTGSFQVQWTAPMSGEDVTFYSSGLAANGNGEPEGDSATSTSLLVPATSPDALSEYGTEAFQIRDSGSVLHISNSSSREMSQVRVFDLQGRLIASQHESSSFYNLELPRAERGIIIIHIQIGTEGFTQPYFLD